MAWCNRIVLWLAACSTCVAAAPVPRPRPGAKAKVEFRWVESKLIHGLTEEKGIRTTCANVLSYLHKEPILTNADFADARVRALLGGWSEVEFDLTAQARKKLAAVGKGQGRWLAVLVDGRYFGTIVYPSPVPGYDLRKIFQARSDAERTAAACKAPPAP